MTGRSRAILFILVMLGILILGCVLLGRSMVVTEQAEAARQAERWRAAVETADAGSAAVSVWPGAVPDADNAAVPLRSLQAQFNALSAEDQQAIAMTGEADRDLPRIRAVLEAHPALLNDALEACNRPVFRPDGMTVDEAGFGGEIGDLIGIRTAMRILVAAAHERADRGDMHAASELLRQSMRLADHVQRLPILITAMVALAGDHLVLDAFEQIARHHALPDEAEWIKRLDPRWPVQLLRAGMIGDADVALQAIDELDGVPAPVRMVGALFGFSPARSRARYLEAMAAALEQLSLPAAKQNWAAPQAIVSNDRFADLFFPAFSSVAKGAAERARQRMALRAALGASRGEPSVETAGDQIDPVSGDPLRTVVENGRVRVEVGPADAPEVLIDWPLDREYPQ